MMTTYAIGLIVVVAAIVIVVSALRRPVPVAVRPDDDFVDGVVSDPVPITTPAIMSSDLPVFDELPVDEPEPPAPAPAEAAEETAVPAAEPVGAADESAEAAADEDHIRWTKQLAPQSGALGDEARLRLITDLGMLRAAWCVPLLEQACEEEADPALHAAAQAALARCRETNAV